MGSTLVIRDVASDDDRRAALTVENQAVPWAFESHPRVDARLARPSRMHWQAIAHLGGAPVGAAAIHEPYDTGSGVLTVPVRISVVPEARCTGVGSALAAELSRRMPRGMLFVTAWVDADDQDACTFAERHGLELGDPESARFVSDQLGGRGPEGWQIRTLESLSSEQWRSLHRQMEDVLEEVPGPTADLAAFEQWAAAQRRALDRGDVRLVVVHDGEPVASTGYDTGPGVSLGYVDLTFTSPAHRGQGMAYALKSALHASAGASGLQMLVTEVEDGNTPMLRVNAKLRYEPRRRRWATGHLMK